MPIFRSGEVSDILVAQRGAARSPEQDRCRLYACAWWKAVGSASCFVRHDALTCFFYVTPPCEFRKSNMRFPSAPDPRLATCRKDALCGVRYDHQSLIAKVEVGFGSTAAVAGEVALPPFRVVTLPSGPARQTTHPPKITD